MRNTFSAGISVCKLQRKLQVNSVGQEPKQESVWGKKPWIANLLHKKRPRDMGLARQMATQRQSRSQWLQTFLCLECQCINPRGSFAWGLSLEAPSLSCSFVIFLFSYFIIRSRCLRLCCGKPRVDPAGKTWTDPVSGVNVHLSLSSGGVTATGRVAPEWLDREIP